MTRMARGKAGPSPQLTRVLCRVGAAALLALLAGCASGPPPADWQINAHSLLKSYGKHYLSGDTLLAERHFERARAEIARTGRLDLLARAELTRCALRLAALDTAACTAYERLAAHAGAEEQTYARFLTGHWQGVEVNLMPAQYHGLLAAREETARLRALAEIKDPVSRAIAAAALFRAGQASPEVIALATRTASDQGWRRALLAWLEVQAKRAEAAGDKAGLELIRQRIELVQSSLAGGSASTLSP